MAIVLCLWGKCIRVRCIWDLLFTHAIRCGKCVDRGFWICCKVLPLLDRNSLAMLQTLKVTMPPHVFQVFPKDLPPGHIRNIYISCNINCIGVHHPFRFQHANNQQPEICSMEGVQNTWRLTKNPINIKDAGCSKLSNFELPLLTDVNRGLDLHKTLQQL